MFAPLADKKWLVLSLIALWNAAVDANRQGEMNVIKVLQITIGLAASYTSFLKSEIRN
jgi:hypothetical protein